MRRRFTLPLLLVWAVFGACAPKPIDMAERTAVNDGDATFDVAAARAAGHSPDAIENYLSATRRFDLKRARKVGYSRGQIIEFLAHRPRIADFPAAADVAPSFRGTGYACTTDCSGHQAGYDWAKSTGVTTARQCSGTSQSFVEGCMAYVEEAK